MVLFDLISKLIEKIRAPTEEEADQEAKDRIYRRYEQSELVRFMWSSPLKSRNWWKSDVFQENYKQLCERHRQRLKTPAERTIEDMEQM
ncbi:hypothetical protein Gasu2_30800 [Galdieria sulphuraria]|nr:hypothetical protein Gasu2_30800 [Galdieria sulphuraria]